MFTTCAITCYFKWHFHVRGHFLLDSWSNVSEFSTSRRTSSLLFPPIIGRQESISEFHNGHYSSAIEHFMEMNHHNDGASAPSTSTLWILGVGIALVLVGIIVLNSLKPSVVAAERSMTTTTTKPRPTSPSSVSSSNPSDDSHSKTAMRRRRSKLE